MEWCRAYYIIISMIQPLSVGRLQYTERKKKKVQYSFYTRVSIYYIGTKQLRDMSTKFRHSNRKFA